MGSRRRVARCVIKPTDSVARFPALSKLSTGHCTLTHGDGVIQHVHTLHRRTSTDATCCTRAQFVRHVAINYGNILASAESYVDIRRLTAP